MCSPLVIMMNAGLRRSQLPLWRSNLLYNLTRILVYALLGSFAGEFGVLLGASSRFSTISGIVSLAFGTGVILFGFGILGWLPVVRLEASAGNASRIVASGMGAAIRRGGPLGVIGLGGLNGLLPCGLVYSALLAAAASGGMLPGMVSMLAFGAGTIPALLIVGLGAWKVSPDLRQKLSSVSAMFILLIGLQLLLRGAAGLGWVSHLRLVGVMLW